MNNYVLTSNLHLQWIRRCRTYLRNHFEDILWLLQFSRSASFSWYCHLSFIIKEEFCIDTTFLTNKHLFLNTVSWLQNAVTVNYIYIHMYYVLIYSTKFTRYITCYISKLNVSRSGNILATLHWDLWEGFFNPVVLLGSI